MAEMQFGYGITSSTPTNASESSLPIPPGIHEDVVFKGAFFGEVSDNLDRKALYFEFEKDGKMLRDVMFAVDPNKSQEIYDSNPQKPAKRANPLINLAKGDIPTFEQYLGIQYIEFNKKLNEYATALIENEKDRETGIVNSYEELSSAVIKILTPKIGTKCRLKVVLNRSDYSSIPRYGSFLEPMTVSSVNSNLMITKSDKMEPNPKPGDNLPGGYDSGANLPGGYGEELTTPPPVAPSPEAQGISAPPLPPSSDSK